MSNRIVWKWPVVDLSRGGTHRAGHHRAIPSGALHAPDPGMFQYLSDPSKYHGHFEALAFPGRGLVVHAAHDSDANGRAGFAIGMWLLASRVVDADGPAGECAPPGYPGSRHWSSSSITRRSTSIGGFGLGRTIINAQNPEGGRQAERRPDDRRHPGSQHHMGRPVGRRPSARSSASPARGRCSSRTVLLALAPAAGEKGAMAGADPAGRVRLGAADEPHDALRAPIAFSLLIVASLWMALERPPR